ncbi:hypothetical protein J7I81_14875 [Bacillus sp. ISL-32]|nr:hypothetical protein [Bacillus sp. ISL-32]
MNGIRIEKCFTPNINGLGIVSSGWPSSAISIESGKDSKAESAVYYHGKMNANIDTTLFGPYGSMDKLLETDFMRMKTVILNTYFTLLFL